MGVYKEKKRWKIMFAKTIPPVYTMATTEQAAMERVVHKLIKEKRCTIEEFHPVGGSAEYAFFEDDEDKLQKKREMLLKQLGALDQRLGAKQTENQEEQDGN